MNFGERIHSINRHGLEKHLKLEALKSDIYYSDVHDGWFENNVDHFDPSNTDTYQQYYQYNEKYYQKSNVYDVVFMMVGGEAPIEGRFIQDDDLPFMQMAYQQGAYIYQLEHRFFGRSVPYGNMNITSIKYLTTEQALEDLAVFIKTISKKFTRPRWVMFGGSYPGSMTAWFAKKYPDLIVGGVASSAPLNIKLDFFEYSMVMEDAIKREGDECYKIINSSFFALQEATLTIDGRNKINQLFNLRPSFDELTLTQLDVTNFLRNVFSIFQGLIQYSYDNANSIVRSIYTTKNLCNFMNKTNGPLGYENIYNVIRWTNKIYGVPDHAPFDNNYWDSINQLKQTTYMYGSRDNSDIMSARAWMWMCCNEFGWFQTTDQGRNIFQQIVPLNFDVNTCTDIFGESIAINFIRDNNRRARKFFGEEDTFQASNIILPNGNLDPWHALGTYVTNKTIHQYPYLIDGTAHCADMYPEYDGEPPSLKFIRDFTKNTVSDFIKAGNQPW
uniref:Serine protease K12H4.7 n=1 Tax=Parastrongyloides trichosuri TaxID=131310 RepID=A0A0N4ZGK0_PARTI